MEFTLINNIDILFCPKGKARRLKQAKEEAQAEIDAYRKERETNFKKYEQQVLVNYVNKNIFSVPEM